MLGECLFNACINEKIVSGFENNSSVEVKFAPFEMLKWIYFCKVEEMEVVIKQ